MWEVRTIETRAIELAFGDSGANRHVDRALYADGTPLVNLLGRSSSVRPIGSSTWRKATSVCIVTRSSARSPMRA